MVSGLLHVFVIATATQLPGITAFVPPSCCGRLQEPSALRAAASQSASSSGIGNVEEAKANLRRALEESRGSSLAPGVQEAAEVGRVLTAILCVGKHDVGGSVTRTT